jgi:PPOX class probable F420-dependent enzyme
MDTSIDPRTRVERFLADEPVVWLSSVRPDGRPHIVPIWFSWDDGALTVLSKPDAQKVRNIRRTPAVMLALGDAEDDFDVGLIEACAEVIDEPATDLPREHLRKYADRMAAIGLSIEEFVATYSQVLRIVPTRFLDWHGRTAA